MSELVKETAKHKEKAFNYEKEKYVSCHDLEYGILLFSNGIKHCCDLNDNGISQNIIPYENNNDIEKTIRKVIEQKKQVIQNNINGKKTFCTHCKHLKEGYWSKQKKIKQINLSLDCICNLKCQYCDKWELQYIQRNKLDIPNLMRRLETCPSVDLIYPVLYSSGEISIQPNMNEILDSLNDYDVCFFSNATKYNFRLLEKIKKKANCLLVSIDCGTSETYKKLKGVNLFNMVCRNIEKYSLNGGNVILKYIITEENTNQDDLDGFMELCVKNKIESILISRDFCTKEINDKLKSAAVKLAYKANKNRIRYYIDGVYNIYSDSFHINYDYL